MMKKKKLEGKMKQHYREKSSLATESGGGTTKSARELEEVSTKDGDAIIQNRCYG